MASLSPNLFWKQDDDTLRRAAEWVADVLDFRARQSSLFTPPANQNTIKPSAPAPAPLPVLVPEVLSPSALNCFSDCSAKWFYRRVLGLPEARTAALTIGSAVHDAISANFRQKIETHEDLPIEGVRLVARDSLERQFDAGDVVFDKEETPYSVAETVDALVSVYMSDAAPLIEPAAVDLPVEGSIGGVSVRGYVDLLDVDGRIIDLKTAGKKPSGILPSHRLQVTTYSMITPGASGSGRLDTLTKTKTVRHYAETFEVTPADRKLTERLYSITLDQMKTGLVAPNRASRICGRKYCSFADRCESDFGGVVA